MCTVTHTNIFFYMEVRGEWAGYKRVVLCDWFLHSADSRNYESQIRKMISFYGVLRSPRQDPIKQKSCQKETLSWEQCKKSHKLSLFPTPATALSSVAISVGSRPPLPPKRSSEKAKLRFHPLLGLLSLFFSIFTLFVTLHQPMSSPASLCARSIILQSSEHRRLLDIELSFSLPLKNNPKLP